MMNDASKISIMPKRLLQGAILLGGCVPVLAGLAGIAEGPGMLMQTSNGALDSHFRYLSGLLLGIGLGFWSTVPRIERQTARFQLLTMIVVTGGLGRFAGYVTGDAPGSAMQAALVMELIVTPALAVAQILVARFYRRPMAY